MKALLLITFLSLLAGLEARAAAPGGLPVDVSQFPNPNALLSDDVANAFTKVIGFALDQRPYEPATPLGTSAGFTLGIEATFVGIPASFFSTLKNIGFSGATSNLTSIPVPRLQMHKGLGPRVDVGFSFLGYSRFRVYGGDIKLILWEPEEGVTWAARFCYSQASLGFVSTKTYTPQLLISKKLDFADPYAGIALQEATGTLDVEVTDPLNGQKLSISKTGHAQGFLAFTGVSFKVVGVNLVLEGAYSSAGVHTLGTKIGLAF